MESPASHSETAVSGALDDRNAPINARVALLLAGERMFATRGFDVSIREINEAAGVRNTSAIYYHFQTRAGLIAAIMETRLTTVDPARRRMVAALDADRSADTLRALAAALVWPLAGILPGTSGYYARFLERCLIERPTFDLPRADAMGGVIEVEARLRNLMAALPDAVREGRLRIVRHMFVSALARLEGELSSGGLKASAFELEVELLIDGLTALLEAPVSAVVGAVLERPG